MANGEGGNAAGKHDEAVAGLGYTQDFGAFLQSEIRTCPRP